ncbi:hypothetical protein KCP69_08065 [Salmonella enterica subsp. enterica]|nr:hypothetical protein KCP69_08065 [Salmonella enterica subsp. enterica]
MRRARFIPLARGTHLTRAITQFSRAVCIPALARGTEIFGGASPSSGFYPAGRNTIDYCA